MKRRWSQIFFLMEKLLNRDYDEKGSAMIDHNFEKRLTSTKVFYSYLSDLIANIQTTLSAKKRLDKQFTNANFTRGYTGKWM